MNVEQEIKKLESQVRELSGCTTKIQEELNLEGIKERLARLKQESLLPTEYMKNGKVFNRVKKMEETTVEIEVGPYWWDLEKFAWMCKTCGRVWAMRSNAATCKHRDFVFYGRTKFYCYERKKVDSKGKIIT